MSLADLQRDGETARQLIVRWALAGMFVMAMHGSVALAIVYWPKPESTVGEPPVAVMIELAPLPVAPEVPPQEVAVGVEQQMSAESAPTEAKEEPVEEEQPELEVERTDTEDEPIEQEQPEPQVEPIKAEPPPEPVEREVETETDTPDLPRIDSAAAVLDALAPPPPVRKKAEWKPDEPKKKKTEQRKSKPKRQSRAQAASAPKPVDAARARTNAAPTPGVGSARSIATWRGSVMAQLNRHKRYPRGGGRGTSSVAFTIDRSGRVLSARLIRSSGSAVLDSEAVALARRASPLPSPPPNVGGRTITLTVPVRFLR